MVEYCWKNDIEALPISKFIDWLENDISRTENQTKEKKIKKYQERFNGLGKGMDQKTG